MCVQIKKVLIFMFMFICWLLKKKKKKKYKELELTKLKFHITRTLSLGSSSTIEEKKRAICSIFVFTKNSSLVNSSIVLHGTQVYQTRVPCGIFSTPKKKKSTSAQVFILFYFFMKLEFHKLGFQKSGILLLISQIMVCC